MPQLFRVAITFTAPGEATAFEQFLSIEAPEGAMVDLCEFDFSRQEWLVKRSRNT